MSILKIILFEPNIPQNTGNIIRLCANSGCELHLVKPLGWGSLNDKKLRRCGLDYHEYTKLVVHESWNACKLYFVNQRIWAIENVAGARLYTEAQYLPGDVLLFGSETKGLPLEVLNYIGLDCTIQIPMQSNQRSLNLANAVAISVYEAWRQLKFTEVL